MTAVTSAEAQSWTPNSKMPRHARPQTKPCPFRVPVGRVPEEAPGKPPPRPQLAPAATWFAGISPSAPYRHGSLALRLDGFASQHAREAPLGPAPKDFHLLPATPTAGARPLCSTLSMVLPGEVSRGNARENHRVLRLGRTEQPPKPYAAEAAGPEAVTSRASREATPASVDHRDAAPAGPGPGGE